MDKPDLVSVWEHYGGSVVGRQGGWAKATCCIHDDRTASASVNEDEQKWSCFTCDKGGDSLDLIQIKEGIGFKEAVEHARSAGFESGEAVSPQRAGGSLRKPVGRGGSGLSGGKRNQQGGLFRPPIRQGSSSLAR